ncbi:MAG TPA: allantoate amidohydrolase [Mycobacteriales bacterium]
MGSFEDLWRSQADIGRSDAGGYRRFAWTPADLECRAWFTDQAGSRGLAVEPDRNGNLWAWWGDPRAGDAVVTGSHLDSVPDGGGYDGPLGVVSAFAAVDELRSRGTVPRRPVAVVCFSDEEGARFGVSCVGSRLATGVLDPDQARALRDLDGTSLAGAMAAAGVDPDRLGPDPRLLDRVGCFVELHVEQGRGLVNLGAPVGLAGRIWPHGRWRFEFTGRADHAGTTRLADRQDAMLPAAAMVLASRALAAELGAHATVGRLVVEPNGTNAIASRVRAWLDARAPEESTVRRLVERVGTEAGWAGSEHGVAVRTTEESWTPVVEFAPDTGPFTGLAEVLGDPPILPTGAGHDAGILAGVLPAAMLFVRNPTGVSHSPAEHAEPADCLAGVRALADTLEYLACR